MKLSTALLPLLCATWASCRSIVQDPILMLDDDLKVPGENPLFYCADPSDYLVDIDFVDIVPNPPIPGEKLRITAVGSLKAPVEEGTEVALQVKIGQFITVIKGNYDFCSNAPKINLECPLDEGKLFIEREADIPSLVPPATYNVEATMVNQNGDDVVCMKASTRITRPS